jgi:hypothetical protein
MDQCDVAPSQGKAENVAAGYATAALVFEGWRNSEGHNVNMKNPAYRSIGIARHNNPGATYGWYWANKFSAEVVTAPPPPAPVNICGSPSLTSSPNNTSLSVGSPMNFTASVSGCSNPQYHWWVYDGSAWNPQGTWSNSSTFSWTPTAGGSYQVAFWAKQTGSNPANGVFETSSSVNRTVNAAANICANPTLSSNPNTPTLAYNTQMLFTAGVSGCTQPSYHWWLFDGTNWMPQGTWTNSNTFNWAPPPYGGLTYIIAYWAKQANTTPVNGVYDVALTLQRSTTNP